MKRLTAVLAASLLLAACSKNEPPPEPVRPVLSMAPLSLMFGRQTLADVHVPVLLYSGENDKLVFPDKNADALARKLPVEPEFKVIPGAGHFVFMAPCNDEQMAAMPGLCTDAQGVDREDIHRDLIYEAGRFFSESLESSPIRRTASSGQ